MKEIFIVKLPKNYVPNLFAFSSYEKAYELINNFEKQNLVSAGVTNRCETYYIPVDSFEPNIWQRIRK